MFRGRFNLMICAYLLLSACNPTVTEQHTDKPDTAGTVANSTQLQPVPDGDAEWEGGEPPEWLREVVYRYLRGTKNEMIRLNGADSESWMIDDVRTTDTGRYITVRIGRHVAEEDGSEPRFVTDQWIGIDSETRTIYEYDVARDTTMIWDGK